MARRKIDMLPKSYKKQDSCKTCQYVFTKVEYEGEDEHYCTLGVSERPKCGSVAMNETFECRNNEVLEKELKEWNKWKKDILVDSAHICAFWKEIPAQVIENCPFCGGPGGEKGYAITCISKHPCPGKQISTDHDSWNNRAKQ